MVLIKILAVLALLIVSTRATAGQIPSFNCAKASTSVEKLICRDLQLGLLDDEVAALYKMRRNGLDPDGLAMLKTAQMSWILSRDRECDLRTKDELSAISCLANQYEKRIAGLRLSTDPPRYRLTPSEAKFVRENADGTAYVFQMDDAIMGGTLSRLISSVIDSRDDINDYVKAISGPGEFHPSTNDRFIFGSQCARHACTWAQGGFVVDSETGDVAFAINYQDKIVIFEKSCASDELKNLSRARFTAPWYTGGSIKTATSVVVKVSDCAWQ